MCRWYSPRSRPIASRPARGTRPLMAANSPMRSSRQFRFLSEPRAALAAALARWARSRQGDDVPPVTLQARRIYILPTPAGLAAAALLFLIVVGRLDYD